MFLAVTADVRHWDTSDEILFLSEACRLHDHRSADWQNQRFHILPNLWESPEFTRTTIPLVEKISEKFQDLLGRRLSIILGLEYDELHWRVLLHPWLQRYIHILYDRYAHIKHAIDLHPNLTIGLMPESAYQFTPALDRFAVNAREDLLNFQICSQILRALTGDDSDRLQTTSTQRIRRPKGLDADLPLSVDICLYKIHHRHEEMLAQLELELGSSHRQLEKESNHLVRFPETAAILNDDRIGLGALPAQSEFESVLVRTFPQNFPTLYLEGYWQAVDIIRSKFGWAPKVLVSSAHGWYVDEGFKFYAAMAARAGTRIVNMQAGGGNGTYLYFAQQAHEERISHRELVWGWSENDDSKRKKIPCFFTSKILTKKSTASVDGHEKGDKVLFLQAGPFERYFRWMYSTPYGGGLGEPYLDWQIRFFDALPTRVQNRILYREKPQRNDGQCFTQRVQKRFPQMHFESAADTPSPDRILGNEIRLVVVDHSSTGYLESMTANKPTIIFWNPDIWIMNAKAQKDLDALKDLRMFHDSPESAAQWAAEIYDDPMSWWSEEGVQEARKRMIETYAYGTVNWLEEWKAALRDEVHETQDRGLKARSTQHSEIE